MNNECLKSFHYIKVILFFHRDCFVVPPRNDKRSPRNDKIKAAMTECAKTLLRFSLFSSLQVSIICHCEERSFRYCEGSPRSNPSLYSRHCEGFIRSNPNTVRNIESYRWIKVQLSCQPRRLTHHGMQAGRMRYLVGQAFSLVITNFHYGQASPFVITNAFVVCSYMHHIILHKIVIWFIGISPGVADNAGISNFIIHLRM